MKELLVNLCIVILFGFTSEAVAQQLKFAKSTDGETLQFNFQWLDQAKQTHTLEFTLDNSAVRNQYQNQKAFKPEVAQRYVYVELMKEAQNIDPKEARVQIKQRRDRIEIQVTSRYQEMLDKWNLSMSEKQQSAFDAYLYDHHYTHFTNHVGQQGVIPDHTRYIQETQDVLQPVAQAINKQLAPGRGKRDSINLLLSWIQSIPYNELTNRIDASGAGFFTPIEVLTNNKGDCDSKATLTASVIRSLFPDLNMAMVYLPNHALLAVDLRVSADEKNIVIDDTQYVLVEPTGPAMVSIGKISDDTARHIGNGTYRVVMIP